jgi:hypothetical protein
MLVHPMAPTITRNKSLTHNFEAVDNDISLANFDVDALGQAGTDLTLI